MVMPELETNTNPCPICSMNEILDGEDMLECATCGHEWAKPRHDGAELPLQVVDANGHALSVGDSVTLTKDLKVKGSGKTLKAGTKVKKIRLVDPGQNAGHNIDAKADGMAVLIRSRFVKKA